MSNQAQFTAMVKKMATDDKKMVLSLELVGNIEPTSLVKLVDMIGDKVTVNLGNPQMAIEFDENERERRGLSVTTDQSGVVTSISGNNEDGKDDADDLEDGGDEGEESKHVEHGEHAGDEPSENGEGSESTPIVQTEDSEGNTPDPEQQSQEESDGNTNDGDQEANKQDDAVAAIDKDKLVAFILSGQAPAFEETEYDFPALLARKQNGETWIKIASSIGTSSSKLQTAWSKYKKLVAEHMAKNGEEPGAA
ncbi:hypothetical protein [Brevibacillus fortis]|uniref:hypothetical protein n=1 Tax=Brevibacillus fortis TaxID=2126352 RepID=UPI0038FC45DE